MNMGGVVVLAADNGFGDFTYGHDIGTGEDKLPLQLFVRCRGIHLFRAAGFTHRVPPDRKICHEGLG